METQNRRVLLVEDARDIQLVVRNALDPFCTLDTVSTIKAADAVLHQESYSLLLLDITLPDGDGFEYCQKLRNQNKFSDLPIIFLTGKTELESKVYGFEVGADDYITKPFEPEELKARVLGKLRRSKSVESSFMSKGFKIDYHLQKAFMVGDAGKETALPLTPIEFKLLGHFLKNEGKVFSRQELLDLFWADSAHVSKHTVDTHISSLRKKMGEKGGHLRSIFKQGYSFSVPKGSEDHVAGFRI
ncbi:MAG: response regulator transcription factor [Bdellovibrio sp.]|nr:response regulator transcription factor [Bdellovibrio sp.]